jgi:uncharacterized protein (DUF1697 family)
MTDLAALFKSLGWNDAVTFIQSGNVIFNDPGKISRSALTANQEKAIFDRFSFTVPVMIRTDQELKDLIVVNPFLDEINFDPSRLAVIFLHDKPEDIQIQKVKDISYPPDKFKIIGSEIFIYCPNGFGKTKLYTNFFETKMGVIGTGRNWRSVTTILNIAESKF